MGEKWFKHVSLDLNHYQPFLKPRYQADCKTIFPFSHILERYAPLMKVIMKYFTCEGRFSRLYSYHIRILMHFTSAKLLHLPYYLYRSIYKMSYIVQKRPPSQQMQSLFHHSLIKMIVLHHLEQQGIPWEVFITHDVFKNPQNIPLQILPSSSHPPSSAPPSAPTDHDSSSPY